MGEYGLLVKQFIRLFNTYARRYTVVNHLGKTSVSTSSAQIHTIEYILESKGQKMSEIASRMGITRSTFTANVKKLEKQGYLQKKSQEGNRKEVYITVTKEGKELYCIYAKHIYALWYKKMFELVDTIPKKHRKTLGKILDGFTEAFLNDGILLDPAPSKD